MSANSKLQKDVENFLAYESGVRCFSPHTIYAYKHRLKQFVEFCQSCNITKSSQIDRKTVYGYLQSTGYGNKTKYQALVAVKMFCRFLMMEGCPSAELAGASQIPNPRLEKKVPFVLSAEQVKKLLETPGPKDPCQARDRAILELLYATGLRCGEVSDLKIKDLHFGEGYLKCLGKGSKEREVPVSEVARQSVNKYLQIRRYEEKEMLSGDCPVSEYVFVSQRRGIQLNRHCIWRLVKKYAIRAGLPAESTVHTLRHSFATHLVANGADLRSVQMLLGHSSLITTEIYVNLDKTQVRRVYDKCCPMGRS